MKKRTRLPFILITKLDGVLREETIWDFSVEEIEKRQKKYLSDRFELVSIKPYPKSFSVLVDMGNTELYYCIDADNEKEANKIASLSHPNKKIKIKEVTQVIL